MIVSANFLNTATYIKHVILFVCKHCAMVPKGKQFEDRTDIILCFLNHGKYFWVLKRTVSLRQFF